ncbi:hypothetical protein F5Y04DRAFT_36018 [Hypomontagnella monticulosa]|nr:hypothetical protein F5Y04DRAFT_36018 [Hypomontagnella monticulosa]
MAQACRTSREVYFTHYGKQIGRKAWDNVVPYCGTGDEEGWLNPIRDVVIWSMKSIIGPTLNPSILRRVPTVTLCLHRDEVWAPFAAGLRGEAWQHCVLASTEYDSWDLMPFFEKLIRGRAIFDTVNIFPLYHQDHHDVSKFILLPGQFNAAISRLFVNDTVLLIDLHNEAEVKRAATTLETHRPAKACLDALMQAYFEVNRLEREGWNLALSQYKVLWLSMSKRENLARWQERMNKIALGEPEPDQDENVPMTRAIYRKMPKLRPVFVIMTC